MPVVTGLQASMYITIVRQNQNCAAMTEAEGLYLLAYGLEGALLLVFGAVDSSKAGLL